MVAGLDLDHLADAVHRAQQPREAIDPLTSERPDLGVYGTLLDGMFVPDGGRVPAGRLIQLELSEPWRCERDPD